MRISEFVSLSVQGSAPRISLVSFEGQNYRIRAADILTVGDLPPIPKSTIYTGSRAIVFFGSHSLIVRDTAANIDAAIDAALSQMLGYVLIEDQKAQNTPGGTFTSGAARTRDLNTIVANAESLASLGSNQVTLVPGIYIIRATAPAMLVNRHQAWLQDLTAGAPGTTIKRGTSGFQISTSGTAPNYSTVVARITPTSDIVIELQHQCATTRATNGFGLEANLGTEVYSQFEAWKIG